MSQIKTLCAASDLSCLGKCALSICVPVINAAGVEVYPLPTALLSANTSYEGFRFFDMSVQMEAIINHWKDLGHRCDGFLSGYLTGTAQVALIRSAITALSPSFVVVDPIMGDHGSLYKNFGPEMVEAHRGLAKDADFLLANLTEACLLCGLPYPSDIDRLGQGLLALGAKTAVIKGVRKGEKLLNYVINHNDVQIIESRLLPYDMYGTGDLFAALFCVGLLREMSPAQTVEFASSSIVEVMEYSHRHKASHGLLFEPLLSKLYL